MTDRERRMMRITLLSVITLVFALRILPWFVRGIVHYRDTVQGRVTALARARELVAESPVVRDSLRAALGRVVDLAPVLIAGRSRAEAAATLGSLLSAIANRGALRVLRTESLVDSSRLQPRAVSVRTELEGDVRGLARFLQAVEEGQPLLTVREITITALDPGAPAEVLRLDVVIAGLYWDRAEP